VKKKHSGILRKREVEVATRLSPSWNGQARKTVLSSDGISYEVSEKFRVSENRGKVTAWKKFRGARISGQVRR